MISGVENHGSNKSKTDGKHFLDPLEGLKLFFF